MIQVEIQSFLNVPENEIHRMGGYSISRKKVKTMIVELFGRKVYEKTWYTMDYEVSMNI
jgi:hypothetical protein